MARMFTADGVQGFGDGIRMVLEMGLLDWEISVFVGEMRETICTG